MARLDQICTLNMGQSPDSSSYNETGEGIPFFQGNADFGKIHPKVRVWCSAPTKVAHTGDVLISVRAPIGALNIADRECCIGRGLAALTVNEALCIKDYLWYAIKSKVDELNSKGTGSTFKAISKSVLAETNIPLPSLVKQLKIAEELAKVDKMITLRKEQLAKLDRLVKSRFIELFEYEDFPKVSFEEVCVFLRNGANIKQTKGAGGYPITRIETLANDVFNCDRLGYADITDLSRYENYLLESGDLLISHINSVAYLGRTVQYKGQLSTPVIHGMNLLCCRVSKQFNPTYIEWFMRTPMAKDYISSITKKAVNQASMTTSDLKKMVLPKPPLELQKQFATFVEQTDKSKLAIQQSLDTLELLKKSLMQEYFG